jgi:acyl-CoA synthetase (AMP-forming)/AMP-acid ligase II
MWRQDDMVMLLDAPSKRSLPAQPSAAALAERVAKPGIVAIPAAPLMHGTGAFAALNTLMLAGTVVTLEGRKFDAAALLDCIDRERVTSMSIVGDAFAKPILRALDAEPDRWDFSSMRVILSSGVMWSSETKQGLLRHNPRLIMIDSLGSSEAIGMAASTTDSSSSAGGANAGRTAAFRLNANTRVIDEDGNDVAPGSGARGLVALKGRTPIGYYKDEEKSAKTFVTIAGDRYSIPGDFAEVEADGTLKLLGRGSQCINTGGEKVYPEEVEEALKGYPGVHDAVVVGVPDERFGEAVIALVEGPATVGEAELIAHVRTTLAAYKSPKHIIRIDSVHRAANGKVDYKRLREVALEALAP